MSLIINELVKEAHQIAIDNGWHEEPREFGTLIALIHDEVDEAHEAATQDITTNTTVRKKKREDFGEELADILIRIFDLAGSQNRDLGSAIQKIGGYDNLKSFNKEEENIDILYTDSTMLKLHNFTSKVLRVYRKKDYEGQEDDITEALARVCILVLQTSKTYRINIVRKIQEKMEKNRKCGYKHGNRKI